MSNALFRGGRAGGVCLVYVSGRKSHWGFGLRYRLAYSGRRLFHGISKDSLDQVGSRAVFGFDEFTPRSLGRWMFCCAGMCLATVMGVGNHGAYFAEIDTRFPEELFESYRQHEGLCCEASG
ncbi:hypothetical protein HOY80DRAFT_1025844 [Tuber brumale]|nr:hypothetical protein HOY80DRAFT_1025844 [Tuber brumale]